MVPPASSTGTTITLPTQSTATLVNGNEDGLISFTELEGKNTEEQVREHVISPFIDPLTCYSWHGSIISSYGRTESKRVQKTF
jgi:hypothetical protein